MSFSHHCAFLGAFLVTFLFQNVLKDWLHGYLPLDHPYLWTDVAHSKTVHQASKAMALVFIVGGGLGFWWVYDIVLIGTDPIYAGEYRVAYDLSHWQAF